MTSLAKKDQTPSQISVGLLREYLIRYGMSESDASNNSAQMLSMDTLQYMNMRILAAAIIFLERHGKLSKKTFIDKNIRNVLIVDIVPYKTPRSKRFPRDEENENIAKIIPITENNYTEYKPSLLRYISAVNIHREDLEEIQRERTEETLLEEDKEFIY